MDSNGVLLREEIIRYLLVMTEQNLNLHYKPYVQRPNVPAIGLCFMKL